MYIKMSAFIILVILSALLVMCQSQKTIKTGIVKSDELEVQILRQEMAQLRKDLQQSKGKVLDIIINLTDHNIYAYRWQGADPSKHYKRL